MAVPDNGPIPQGHCHIVNRLTGGWKGMLRTDLRDFGNDSNLLIVFYVQIMPDDFVMQLHRF
ncbi:hypothetical protein M8494_03595 [Serratia ureilytica]